MNDIEEFLARVVEYFKSQLAASLVEAYKLGSLAHGGFSRVYSDIDLGLILNCAAPPSAIAELIAAAKSLDAEYGKKLSVFWGNPEFVWGRLPVLDRIDLLDHGVPLLHGRKPELRRPSKEEIHREQRQSIERSWQPRLPELMALQSLAANQHKPYIRAILYAARLIYTWDNLLVGSNDCAVEYLRRVQPARLDLNAIEMALACRNEQRSVDEVFALRCDLGRLSDSALAYISRNQ